MHESDKEDTTKNEPGNIPGNIDTSKAGEYTNTTVINPSQRQDDNSSVPGSGLRIGVFVCDCGSNIAGVVDVPALVEFASALDHVVFAEEGKWICGVDYLSKIKEHIVEHNLNRVVVACCTPRTHEPTFKATLKEAGLNPFLLEFVSIREQSSWVHQDDPELATETAKDLISMGVAKARYLEPGEEIKIPVGTECLVIGGGIAGITAALSLGDLGFKVYLVERETELGGNLNKLNMLSPEDISAADFIKPRITRVVSHENIEVYTSMEISEIKGYVGNFSVTLKGSSEVTAGDNSIADQVLKISTIIVSTGMRELEPTGLFGYQKYPNVITQLQLEELLRNKDEKIAKLRDVAFINCVNSRNRERGCCNVGCLTSIKNIKALKQENPNINAYLFFRDFNITGLDVQYHYSAMEDYSAAFRYTEDKPPQVSMTDSDLNNTKNSNAGQGNNNDYGNDNGKLQIKSYDIFTGDQIELGVDLLVLTPGYIGDPSKEQLKGLLKVSTNAEGFFSEAHVKLRPLDFANEGIYVCGCARSPKGVRETIEESIGAAMRAAIPMKQTFVETEGIVANLDPEKCLNCGICLEACAYSAPEVVDKVQGLEIIKAICKGCGTCAASCPAEAIDIIHFSDEQLLAQVDSALASKPDNKILVFACHWCALGAVDNAGVSRFQYPPNLRIIRVMCSGRVDPRFIIRAFERGARGVLVAGCEIPTCHYISGNFYAEKKVMLTRKLLELSGIDPSRLRLEWLSAAQGARFAQVAKEFDSELNQLGELSNDNFKEQDLLIASHCSESPRLRIIASKLKEFVESGNRYSELFTNHELDRLIDECVYDEFIAEKIKQNLIGNAKSVRQLSEELDLTTEHIFRSLIRLLQFKQVEITDLDGNLPLYSLSPIVNPDSAQPNSSSEHTLEPQVAKKVSSNENFEYIIQGTAVNALSAALEYAKDGSNVLLLSTQPSFVPEHWLLSENFDDYTNYYNEYTKLLSQVYHDQNIKILRNTKITREQEHGAVLKIELLKSPIFVDEEKCNNCGKCVEVCPVNILDFDCSGLSVKHAIYHPWPQSEYVKFAISKLVPYCQASCAINMDVRSYIGKISDGDYAGALEVIRRTNQLPDICGKVCDHNCELTCARGFKDEPLAIRRLKRFVTEEEYQRLEKNDQPMLSIGPRTFNTDPANKVAIIGSGPAGLAAAYILAHAGFPVTIFEAEPVPGGMLRLGIPDYRLPPEALQREVQAILDLGVELRLKSRIGDDIKFSELKDQGFKAIFIGVGAQKALDLGIAGEDFTGVHNGLEFLKLVNLHANVDNNKQIPGLDIGKSVAVIGGGNVAVDCARTARRLGAEKVVILYRRSRAEMPAAKNEEELEACEAEGIEINYLVAPQKIIPQKDGSKKVGALQCIRTELGMPEPSGRRRPVVIDDSEFTIEVDSIIVAVGQTPALEFISELGQFELTTRSTFIVDPRTGCTNIEGVYAGGDVVSGPANVVGAISWGQKAAGAIAEYLTGVTGEGSKFNNMPAGELRTDHMELLRLRKNRLIQARSFDIEQEEEKYHKPQKLLEVVNRITSFAEVEETFTEAEARSEADRCLSCRACIGCGVCQSVCPKDAIDYDMRDQIINVETAEVLHYPKLVEGRFGDRYGLLELYKNNLNVITPVELEYMLSPDSVFSGRPSRPADGMVPESIAFLFLPENKFVNKMTIELDNLEFVLMNRILKYINQNYPEINTKIFINRTEFTSVPEHFKDFIKTPIDLKSLQDQLELVEDESFQINYKDGRYLDNIEIENKGTKKMFELCVVNAGLDLK